MTYVMNKYGYLTIILLFSSFAHASGDQENIKAYSGKKDSAKVNKIFDDGSNGCCTITVGTLRATRVIARCIDAKRANLECVDADALRARDLGAHTAYLSQLCTQTLCAQTITSGAVDAQSVCTNNLSVAGTTCLADLNIETACVSNLAAHDACVTGTLRVANLLNCGFYRATAVYSTLTTYTLGDYLDFDTVLDDPAGSIVTSPNFAYVAPISGYYIVTLQVDQQSLQPFNGNPILGSPVSNPQIYVNGLVHRQSYIPYLTFFSDQKATQTSLIHLIKGDVVQTIFEVLALNQFNGIVPIAGSIGVLGDGSEADQSLFKICLLNVDCAELPCTPCGDQNPCAPCTPRQCGPYTPPAPCPPCEPCTPCQCS